MSSGVGRSWICVAAAVVTVFLLDAVVFVQAKVKDLGAGLSAVLGLISSVITLFKRICSVACAHFYPEQCKDCILK